MSLRVKVMLGVLVPVALTLGAFAYLQLMAHEETMRMIVDSVPTASAPADSTSGTTAPADPADPLGLTVDAHLSEYLRYTLLSLGGAILLSAIVLGVVLERLVARPINELAGIARRIAGGEIECRAPVRSGDELGQLAGAVNHMADAMEAKARLEVQLRQHSQELEGLYEEVREKEKTRALLLAQVITAQEEERKRVARHLHDELAQSLAGLVLSLDAAEAVLDDCVPDIAPQIRRTREIVSMALDQTRRLILDLRPTMLDDLGLVPAIRWYADTRLTGGGTMVVVETEGDQSRLPPELETAVFRVAQEAMNNAARHSGARRVSVRLSRRPEAVTLVVEDDGCGFDVGKAFRALPSGESMGLLGMRERVDMLGGVLEISSTPGGGTHVEARIPVAAEDQS
jgi:signal transduction histidine kinase